MKGQLIKRKDRWDLYLVSDGSKIASTAPNPMNKLSLKNCEEIENGYDLDVLAKSEAIKISETEVRDEKLERIYKRGFQKALEILGDKKFSVEDIQNFIDSENPGQYPYIALQLKQKSNEWDVEIEMICPHPMDTYRCGLQYGCDEYGCNHPNQVPYLDKDSCLILKRILN